MTDPREPFERRDPDENTPDVGEPEKVRPEQGNDAEELGPDANELDADNEVEQDTIDTLDPENPPA
ncbi:hypothetical protein [Agromyces albus]|uniref:Uncharacterized protein n=1 Tax=Agromyces albus TaxID=205332 RepID=A0A4Q2L908_9MICO|nr:hypothetical protein [Agromyces albus]RXZ73052.1 hypothetical protein ESP51_02215 [Agromyces albus]